MSRAQLEFPNHNPSYEEVEEHHLTALAILDYKVNVKDGQKYLGSVIQMLFKEYDKKCAELDLIRQVVDSTGQYQLTTFSIDR